MQGFTNFTKLSQWCLAVTPKPTLCCWFTAHVPAQSQLGIQTLPVFSHSNLTVKAGIQQHTPRFLNLLLLYSMSIYHSKKALNRKAPPQRQHSLKPYRELGCGDITYTPTSRSFVTDLSNVERSWLSAITKMQSPVVKTQGYTRQ